MFFDGPVQLVVKCKTSALAGQCRRCSLTDFDSLREKISETLDSFCAQGSAGEDIWVDIIKLKLSLL